MTAKEYLRKNHYKLFLRMTESHVSIVEFENVMESYHEAKSKEEAIEFAKFFITWRNKSHNKNRMTSYQMAYRQFLAAFGKEQEG